MHWEQIDLPTELNHPTRLWLHCGTDHAPLALLFHGVHSCARPEPGNKYGLLGNALAAKGYSVGLVETSRDLDQSRHFKMTPDQWILQAFGRKTFHMEAADGLNAATRAVELAAPSRCLLWGFSLGGLLAALAAASIPKADLMICGTGITPRPGTEKVLTLPILSTLPDFPTLAARLKGHKPARLQAYWGTEDATFEESSCRQALELLHADQVTFQVCYGADHGFRHHKGQTDNRWLYHLLDQACALLDSQTADQSTQS